MLYMTITIIISNVMRHEGYHMLVTYVTITVTTSCDI